LGTLRLRTAGLFCDDDLVDLEDGGSCFGGQLDGGSLARVEIEDVEFDCIADSSLDNVNSGIGVSGLMRCVETGEQLGSIDSSILCDALRKGLEGVGELLDGVLLQTRTLLSPRFH
ncbi:hypothetical protein PENTCL1PPCAC_13767, partial [Pristionchus entomophagus]